MKKFFAVIGVLFFMVNVALADGNHFYLDEAIPGIYTMMDTTTKLAANYVKPVRKVETGEYVYCVSPGVAINPDGNYTKITQNQWNKLNITKEKYQKMQIISYYGYMYKNHTDLKWYAITQYLIWQEVLPEGWSVYFTETLRGPKSTMFDSMIEELQTLVDNYYKSPNFKTNMTGSYKNVKSYKDSYGVLNNYVSSNSKVTINNNMISLQPSDNNYSFTLTYNTTNEKSNLYIYNDAQWVISRGTVPLKSYNFNVVIPKGSLEITKSINYSNLDYIPDYIKPNNLKFSIYNDDFYYEYVTDEEGKISIDKLDIGEYYIKEIDPPNYLVKDDKIYNATITKDNISLVNIVNEIAKSNITIHKSFQDQETNEKKDECNATFAFYNDFNEEMFRKNTNDNGYINFSLPLGNYSFTQLSGMSNYDLINPQILSISNTDDIFLEFINYPIITEEKEDEKKEEEKEKKEDIIDSAIEGEKKEDIKVKPIVKKDTNLDNKDFENPQTSDNILIYFGIITVSISFFVIKIAIKKGNKTVIGNK